MQITDFENAALTIFVVLLSRAVLLFNLNFYMKISTVDENMARASARAAVAHQKFLFRCIFAVRSCGILNAVETSAPVSCIHSPSPRDKDECIDV